MAIVRAIGRGALTGLAINYIVGSSILGMPGELNRLLGPVSPFAMVIGAVAMAIIVLCTIEVASGFRESGGFYLYVRTAFGPLAGLLVAWFWMLAMVGGIAAASNAFVDYLAGLVPALEHGAARAVALVAVIGLPIAVNYFGVRGGAALSSALAIAKLLPLILLVVVGLAKLDLHAPVVSANAIVAPGAGAWLTVLLMTLVAYGGWEDALAPTGEVKDPGRTIPFALLAGLIGAMVLYFLVQLLTVTALGSTATTRPLALLATKTLGETGGGFMTIAAMLSTYGYVAAATLAAPRLLYSLAANGDLPSRLASVHPRFGTPAAGLLGVAVVALALAATGTFLWALALAGGAMMVLYGGGCAALLRFRRQPTRDVTRIPGGQVLAVLGMLLCVALLTQLDGRQALLMLATGGIAVANWWLVARGRRATSP